MNRKKTLLSVAGLMAVAVLGFAAGTQYPYYIAPFRGMGARNNTLEFAVQVPSAGAAAIFAPGTTNTNALGSTALRFSNVFTTLLNASGAITASGGIVASNPFRIPTVDVAVTSPTANVGDMVATSAGVVYVSTNSAGILTSWMKVGTQS